MSAQPVSSRDANDPVHRILIAAACAAPSIHNTQPWLFRTDAQADTIEVFSHPLRRLPRTDPQGRALHLSVGAALFNLRVAAVHLSREPVVRLMPDPSVPNLLAVVRLAGRPRASLTRRPDLYRAVWQRRSSRFPFTPEPVPSAVLAEATEAAHQDGATLWLPEHTSRVHLLELTAEAEQRNGLAPERLAESLNWIAGPGDDTGVPPRALGALDSDGLLPMRNFTPQRTAGRPKAEYEPDPRLLMLVTRSDHPVDWLHAGQALQHALLVLTLHGLRASMLHQALEWPDLRSRLARSLPHRGAPQMLLRAGYGPVGFPTPRRMPVPPTDQPVPEPAAALAAVA
ncbi:hypothetical protein ABTY61_03565 [Kitasatospora sp. NPDC096128]|uniref:Acg family FMN-binding oxidoreductase n=1 Tax=Kitasatospora sp. NPDC096128 TaxID=3155547 RepID=UPI0033285DE6